MPRKCSAPLCALDDSGGFFRLFPLPINIEVRSEWQARIGVQTAMENVHPKDEIYLCEIHFDELCWDDSGCQEILKGVAVPSIFQHTTPLPYVDKLYAKLRSGDMCPQIGEQGMHSIIKLKSEGVLEERSVQNELIRFSCLLATSAMQKLRISLKSAEMESTKVENIKLTEEINELLKDIKFNGSKL